jgi:hypothetical protein
MLSLFIAIILDNFDTKNEEIKQRQQQAYERLTELVKSTSGVRVSRTASQCWCSQPWPSRYFCS